MRRRRFNTTSITDFSSQSQVLRGPSGRHQSKCSSTRVGKRITDRQTRWLSWLGPLVCPTTRYTTRFTQHPTSSIQHQTNRHTAPTNREANSLCSATSMYDAPFPRPCRQIDKRCQPACLPTRLHHHAPCTPSTRARRRKERETEKKRGSASLHPQPHTRNAMQASKLLVLQARLCAMHTRRARRGTVSNASRGRRGCLSGSPCSKEPRRLVMRLRRRL
ncbi:hypothetical protein IWX49DRAFT_573412 [Phyllosticta citricarpa]|uniref:Uncharacterized protein n=2 Tax=Phyllosticta TaxID=121621 RepID=A0ABR1MG37_9PEZI